MSETKIADSSFGSFMFGLTIGIVGALLLGTEEGRKTTRKLLRSMSEELEKNENLFQEANSVAGRAIGKVSDQVNPPLESLPDQSIGFNEYPPPPPPLTNRPSRPPTYFESHGEPLIP